MADLDDLSGGQLAALFTGGCLALIIVLILGTIFNGWALMLLWGWFVVIPFGLPALSLGQALGLSMVVSFMTYQYIDCQPDKDQSGTEKVLTAVAYSIFRPLFIALLGRILYFFTYGQ